MKEEEKKVIELRDVYHKEWLENQELQERDLKSGSLLAGFIIAVITWVVIWFIVTALSGCSFKMSVEPNFDVDTWLAETPEPEVLGREKEYLDGMTDKDRDELNKLLRGE